MSTLTLAVNNNAKAEQSAKAILERHLEAFADLRQKKSPKLYDKYLELEQSYRQQIEALAASYPGKLSRQVYAQFEIEATALMVVDMNHRQEQELKKILRELLPLAIAFVLMVLFAAYMLLT